VPGFAAKRVRLNADVIAAVGGVSVQRAKQATPQIPILFSAVVDSDCVGSCCIPGAARRDITGITGFDPQQAAKQFEMLKEFNANLTASPF
jgi:ABC-type uncharacterized transport system substrate-binding protein